MTKREAILEAVRAALADELPNPKIKRNVVRPTKVDAWGLISVNDGDPGEPEIMLSPLRYNYEHAVEIWAFVQHNDMIVRGPDGPFSLDELLEELGQVLVADPTFGGAVDFSYFGAPEIDIEGPEGAGTISAAMVPLYLIYTVNNPLGQ